MLWLLAVVAVSVDGHAVSIHFVSPIGHSDWAKLQMCEVGKAYTRDFIRYECVARGSGQKERPIGECPVLVALVLDELAMGARPRVRYEEGGRGQGAGGRGRAHGRALRLRVLPGL